ANLVLEVAPLIKMTRSERAAAKAKATLAAAKAFVASLPAKTAHAKETLTSAETWERANEDWVLVRDIVRGKAKERFAPLVEKLAGKAYFENDREVPVAFDEAIAAE